MNTPSWSWNRRQVLGLGLLATTMFQRTAWASPAVQRDSRTLMGTRLDITLEHADPHLRQAAMDAAWVEMSRLTHMMSRYQPDSVVSALRVSAGRRPLQVAPEMMAILQSGQHMARLSAGRFDMTVGAYSEWDFTPDKPRIPTASELARERPLVNHQDLILDDSRMTAHLRQSGMRLDLGGIAKLPILVAGMSTLKRHGVRNAMLNGGGDVLVSGQLQGRDWRVGLRDARAPARLLGVVSLSDGFVASSGDYERCFVRNGRLYHHILAPGTGQPTQGPHGVTLMGPLEAINGLGTAIMASGSDWGRSILAGLSGDVDALIVEHDHTLWSSKGMTARLQPSAG
jgi:thiamine biosynthesis lipoprotein